MINVQFNDKAKQVLADTLDLSGSKVVNELPQVGKEHIIYELQEKKKVPSLIPRINDQMVSDGVSDERSLFVLVFDTSEDMTNALTPIIPGKEIPFHFNYIIKEDKLIMSKYLAADWQFTEVTKVSDYKFDLSSVLGQESSGYLVMLKEYLGKTSEESGDIRYTGKLLNDELYTFGANTFCIVLGAPTSGIMLFGSRFETERPVEVPEEYTFNYIPYEKILKYQLAGIDGLNILWVFKSNDTVSSYWIYSNGEWVNVDDMSTKPPLHRTVYGTLTDVEGSVYLSCSLTIDEIVNNFNNGYITILEYKPTVEGSDYYYCAISNVQEHNGNYNLTPQPWSLGSAWIDYDQQSGFFLAGNGVA